MVAATQISWSVTLSSIAHLQDMLHVERNVTVEAKQLVRLEVMVMIQY